MVKKIMSMLLAVVLLFSIAPLHLFDTGWAAAGQRSASTSRSYPMLAAGSSWYKGSTEKSTITEITLMNSGKPSGTVAESWDASAAQDGSIKAYIVGTKLTLVGNGSGKIAANADSSWAFCLFDATKIMGLNLLDTSKVTDMSHMFASSDLASIDVSNFNTANVTNMNSMFSNCKNLISLDVSKFNTAKVMDMGAMFFRCVKLTSLDLSNFNTANVTNMGSMFQGLPLTSLNVSSFNTANVTSMYQMFYDCSALPSLDLSNFNTAKVTNMGGMFSACSALTSLDLSSFNTAKVTKMTNMFTDCNKLQTVTLGKDFKFVADSYNVHLLPAPDSTYISGADGKWYDMTTGTGYTPAQLASVTRTATKTYSALSNTPADVTLGSAKVSGDNIVVTWSTARGASKYNVYRKCPGDISWKVVGTVAGTSFTDTNVTAGNTYTYTVRGVASDGKTLSSSYNKAGVSAIISK